MSLKKVKIISENLINVVHFARSIVLGHHSIPKINWGSFRGRCEEKWGSFRGQFGDHFRMGDHFGGCTIPFSGRGKVSGDSEGRVAESQTFIVYRRGRVSLSNLTN